MLFDVETKLRSIRLMSAFVFPLERIAKDRVRIPAPPQCLRRGEPKEGAWTRRERSRRSVTGKERPALLPHQRDQKAGREGPEGRLGGRL